MFNKLKRLIHTIHKRLRINKITNRRTSTISKSEKRDMEKENFIATTTGMARAALESDDASVGKMLGKAQGKLQKRRPALIPADADLSKEDEEEIRLRTGGFLAKMEDGDVRGLIERVGEKQRRDAENRGMEGVRAGDGKVHAEGMGYGFAYGYGIGGGEPYVYPQRRKRKACEAMEEGEDGLPKHGVVVAGQGKEVVKKDGGDVE